MHTPEIPISLYLRSLAPHVPPEELMVLQEYFFSCIKRALEPKFPSGNQSLRSVWDALIAEARRNGMSTQALNLTLKGIHDEHTLRMLHITEIADLRWRQNIDTLGEKAFEDIRRYLENVERSSSQRKYDLQKLDAVIDKHLVHDLMMAHQASTDALWEKLVLRSLQQRIPAQLLLELGPFVQKYLTEEVEQRMFMPDIQDCPARAFDESMQAIDAVIQTYEGALKTKLESIMKPLMDTAHSYRLLATYLRFRIAWTQIQETACLIKES